MSQDTGNDRERGFFRKQAGCQGMAKTVKSLPIPFPLPDPRFFHHLAADLITSRMSCQFSIRRPGTQKDIGLVRSWSPVQDVIRNDVSNIGQQG